MQKQLDLAAEAEKLPYDSKKRFLLSQDETAIHKMLLSTLNKLGENFTAEITHGRDEYGRDLVVKQKDPLGNQFIGVIVKKGTLKVNLLEKLLARSMKIIFRQNRQLHIHVYYMK